MLQTNLGNALWKMGDWVTALQYYRMTLELSESEGDLWQLHMSYNNVGIIEFGRTYSQYEVMQGAAREGARRAAVGATLTQVQQAVTQAADPYTLTNQPAMDITCTPDTTGQPVTVSWVQTFQISIPFLPPATINRTIKGVFRCE